MFINTVRSSRSWEAHDKKFNLGYLSQPKRLNSSLSRAVALLVVIGDPYALYRDSNWKALIHYCLDNDSYLGLELNDNYLKKRVERDKPKLNEEPLKELEEQTKPINSPKKSLQPSALPFISNKPPTKLVATTSLTASPQEQPIELRQSFDQKISLVNHEPAQFLLTALDQVQPNAIQMKGTNHQTLHTQQSALMTVSHPYVPPQQSNLFLAQSNRGFSAVPSSNNSPSTSQIPPQKISLQSMQDVKKYLPAFTPNPNLCSETQNSLFSSKWTCICSLGGNELISYLTGLGCPSVINK